MRVLTAVLISAMAMFATGCGGGGVSTPSPTSTPSSTTPAAATQTVALSISPSAITLPPGGSQAFGAVVTGSTNGAITWSVLEGAAGGSITSSGLFNASPTPGTYHVVATSVADTTKKATASVSVVPAPTSPSIFVGVSPAAVTLPQGGSQAFTTMLTGTINTAVTWSVFPGAGGSITSDGFFSASQTPGTYQVFATSVADPSKIGLATVMVTAVPASGAVSVTVSPATVTLKPDQFQVFTATVTGTTYTDVTWSIPEPAPGTSFNTWGWLNAPWIAGTYHFVATSVADPSKSASATITVLADGSVHMSPEFAFLPPAGVQIMRAVAANATTPAVNWSIFEGAAGSIVLSDGYAPYPGVPAAIYTAPQATGIYHVIATSAADPSKSLAAPIVVGNSTPGADNVDDLIATCPTAAEITAINAKLQITFEADPTAPTLVCTAAAGSADLTRLQERTYQALRVMQHLSFDTPLPWTNKQLYDWFSSTAVGIRFRGDIQYSYCCDPAGVVNLPAKNGLAALQTTRWIDPSSGLDALESLMALLVHEARHIESGPHTCGCYDQTMSEMGAWAAQYYLEEWEAFHSGSFLIATLSAPSPFSYQSYEWVFAQMWRDVNFCDKSPLLAAPNKLDFGTQALNTVSAPRTVAITAGTSAWTSVSSVTIAGANAAEFVVAADHCSKAAVPPSCAVLVTFTPVLPGLRSATLTVQPDSSAVPLTVALSGNGQ